MPQRLDRRRFLAEPAGASIMLSCLQALAGSPVAADDRAMTLDEQSDRMRLADLKEPAHFRNNP